MDEIFGDDTQTKNVFKELLWRAATGDEIQTINKKSAQLKRGQVLYGRNFFANILGLKGMAVERCMDKIEKVSNQVSKQRNFNFTIVTVINYDDFFFGVKKPSNQVSKQRKPETKKEREPLTYEELWKIAERHKISIQDVKETHEAVFNSIENGDKYKVVSVYLTVNNWVSLAIKRGTYEPMDELSFKAHANIHSPEGRKRIEATRLKVEEDEKNGKPIFDFSKFRK